MFLASLSLVSLFVRFAICHSLKLLHQNGYSASQFIVARGKISQKMNYQNQFKQKTNNTIGLILETFNTINGT